MKFSHLAFLVSLAPFTFSTLFAGGKIAVTIERDPMGTIVATSNDVKVEGAAKTGGSYTAKKISIPKNTLSTDMSLLTKHLRDKITHKGEEDVVVTNVKAPVDKKEGTATLTLMGKAKPIKFKYKKDGNNLVASFSIDLKDYGIGGNKHLGVGAEDEANIEATIPMSVFP